MRSEKKLEKKEKKARWEKEKDVKKKKEGKAGKAIKCHGRREKRAEGVIGGDGRQSLVRPSKTITLRTRKQNSHPHGSS